MKAITIKQPFASLIAAGLKEYEFRTWKTKYRGEILIHAGKAVKKAGNLKPVTSDQIVYVELSDPDNIVVYEQEQKRGGIADFFQNVRDFFDLGKS